MIGSKVADLAIFSDGENSNFRYWYKILIKRSSLIITVTE